MEEDISVKKIWQRRDIREYEILNVTGKVSKEWLFLFLPLTHARETESDLVECSKQRENAWWYPFTDWTKMWNFLPQDIANNRALYTWKKQVGHNNEIIKKKKLSSMKLYCTTSEEVAWEDWSHRQMKAIRRSKLRMYWCHNIFTLFMFPYLSTW